MQLLSTKRISCYCFADLLGVCGLHHPADPCFALLQLYQILWDQQAAVVRTENYIRLLDDPYFWIALKNTAIILGISILLLGIGAFFVAMLLNQPMRGVNVCKALIFAPAIIASIIAGVIWGYLLDPVTGLVNNVLRAIGLDKLALEWIGGKTLSPYSIAFVYFWQQVGYIAAIYLAGLKTIPHEMMEAAAVDGTNFWQRLLHVTIPALRDTFVSVGILIITGSMKILRRCSS